MKKLILLSVIIMSHITRAEIDACSQSKFGYIAEEYTVNKYFESSCRNTLGSTCSIPKYIDDAINRRNQWIVQYTLLDCDLYHGRLRDKAKQ